MKDAVHSTPHSSRFCPYKSPELRYPSDRDQKLIVTVLVAGLTGEGVKQRLQAFLLSG